MSWNLWWRNFYIVGWKIISCFKMGEGGIMEIVIGIWDEVIGNTGWVDSLLKRFAIWKGILDTKSIKAGGKSCTNNQGWNCLCCSWTKHGRRFYHIPIIIDDAIIKKFKWNKQWTCAWIDVKENLSVCLEWLIINHNIWHILNKFIFRSVGSKICIVLGNWKKTFDFIA